MRENTFQNGVYDLKSVSEGYEAFLNAIGIPSFAVFFILRGSETLEMEILEDGSVKSKTITGDDEKRDQLMIFCFRFRDTGAFL